MPRVTSRPAASNSSKVVGGSPRRVSSRSVAWPTTAGHLQPHDSRGGIRPGREPRRGFARRAGRRRFARVAHRCGGLPGAEVDLVVAVATILPRDEEPPLRVRHERRPRGVARTAAEAHVGCAGGIPLAARARRLQEDFAVQRRDARVVPRQVRLPPAIDHERRLVRVAAGGRGRALRRPVAVRLAAARVEAPGAVARVHPGSVDAAGAVGGQRHAHRRLRAAAERDRRGPRAADRVAPAVEDAVHPRRVVLPGHVQRVGVVQRQRRVLGVAGRRGDVGVGGVARRHVPRAVHARLVEDVAVRAVDPEVVPGTVDGAVAVRHERRHVAVVAVRHRVVGGGQAQLARHARVPRRAGRAALREDLAVVDAVHAVVVPRHVQRVGAVADQARKLRAEQVARLLRAKRHHERRGLPHAGHAAAHVELVVAARAILLAPGHVHVALAVHGHGGVVEARLGVGGRGRQAFLGAPRGQYGRAGRGHRNRRQESGRAEPGQRPRARRCSALRRPRPAHRATATRPDRRHCRPGTG